VPQLTKGARKALNQVAALATDIRDDLALARDRTKYNPDFTRDKIADALTALARLEEVIQEDIAPLLERQAPEYEKRLAELEERVAALELTGTIVPLRRKAD
jgi:hypothetical protein